MSEPAPTAGCPGCDGDECWHEPYGYIWCRPHGEHHRPPECPVDEHGQPRPWWEDEVDG